MLATVLVTTLIAGVAGFALMDRARRAAVTAAWSCEHAALRLLAESIAQELGLDLARAANRPGDAVYRALRELPAARALPAPATFASAQDVQLQERALGGAIAVTAGAALRPVAALSADPHEARCLVALEVSVSLARPHQPAIRERYREVRELKLACVTPPAPFDQAGLLVLATGTGDLAGFGGRPAFAGAAGAPHALMELLTHPGLDGFAPLAPAADPAVARALSTLDATALDRRAQLTVGSVAELDRVVARLLVRAGALDGVIRLAFADPVTLAFPRFRGRCLIAASGPVTVKDVKLDDPRQDALTIVSPGRVTVAGRNVEASVIGLADRPDGLTFRERARVTGNVVCRRFPRSAGLAAQELGDCQFQARPAGAAYIAALAPWPDEVQHARDGEDWPAW